MNDLDWDEAFESDVTPMPFSPLGSEDGSDGDSVDLAFQYAAVLNSIGDAARGAEIAAPPSGIGVEVCPKDGVVMGPVCANVGGRTGAVAGPSHAKGGGTGAVAGPSHAKGGDAGNAAMAPGGKLELTL